MRRQVIRSARRKPCTPESGGPVQLVCDDPTLKVVRERPLAHPRRPCKVVQRLRITLEDLFGRGRKEPCHVSMHLGTHPIARALPLRCTRVWVRRRRAAGRRELVRKRLLPVCQCTRGEKVLLLHVQLRRREPGRSRPVDLGAATAAAAARPQRQDDLRERREQESTGLIHGRCTPRLEPDRALPWPQHVRMPAGGSRQEHVLRVKRHKRAGGRLPVRRQWRPGAVCCGMRRGSGRRGCGGGRGRGRRRRRAWRWRREQAVRQEACEGEQGCTRQRGLRQLLPLGRRLAGGRKQDARLEEGQLEAA